MQSDPRPSHASAPICIGQDRGIPSCKLVAVWLLFVTTFPSSLSSLSLIWLPLPTMIARGESQEANIEHGRRHFGVKLVFIIIFICFGSASFGFSNAVIGSTLGQPSFISAMGLDTASNAEALISALLAVYYVGGLFGSFCHAMLADRYGRKVSAAVAASTMVVAAAVCTGANSIGLYITFRFFCGWS